MTKFSFKPAARNGRLPALVANLAWFALTVPPQREFAAQEILHRRGIATFCPFESLWRQKSRYTREKDLRHYPIMPRYVFAGFEDAPSWFHVFQIPLVLSVVGFNDVPARIIGMADFVSKFRNGLRRPNEERHMKTHREYAIGDLAVVTDGALAGRQVVVENIRDKHAFFRITMFGAEMTLSLPIGQLEAA